MAKKRIFLVIFCVFVFLWHTQTFLYANQSPELTAAAAVLIEAETGHMLFGMNEEARIFPAGLTMVLTALVVLDHFEPDDILIAGDEIRRIRDDAARTGHVYGEENSVLNLIRACFFTSGGDSANILAMNVARRVLGEEDIVFTAAERLFAELMNEKAREAGAFNSNFVNPHGFHSSNHFTTAYDMALISRLALENDIIRQISAETRFVRNNRTQTTRNELLLETSPHFYRYATGMRTGRHSQAGDTLAASAARGGTALIAIVSNSPDPGRWEDAALMFEYGFNNFSHMVIARAGDEVGTAPIYNSRLQDIDVMPVYISSDVETFLSASQKEGLQTSLSFFTDVQTDHPIYARALNPPIEKGQQVGTITISAEGRLLYEGPLIAGASVLPRSLVTDVDYYRSFIAGIFFVREAVPYWIIAGLSLIILTYIFIKARKTLRRGRMFGSRY